MRRWRSWALGHRRRRLDKQLMAASSAGHLSTRARWMTLAAMTLANSTILVDQTSVPLAAPT